MRLGSSCELIQSLMLTVCYSYIKTVTLYSGLSILRLPIAAALGVSQFTSQRSNSIEMMVTQYVITYLFFLISQSSLNQATVSLHPFMQ